MAILGGAGNVAGSNPAGTGSSLNYITVGKRTYAYGYSGSVVVNNATVTALEFNSGSNVIKAQIQLTGDFGDMAGSKRIGMIVSFDGQKISSNVRLNVATNAIYDLDPLFVLIPPFTTVKIEITTDNPANIEYYATLTGEAFY